MSDGMLLPPPPLPPWNGERAIDMAERETIDHRELGGIIDGAGRRQEGSTNLRTCVVSK